MSKGSKRRPENATRVRENFDKITFTRCKCGSYRVKVEEQQYECLACGKQWEKK